VAKFRGVETAEKECLEKIKNSTQKIMVALYYTESTIKTNNESISSIFCTQFNNYIIRETSA